MCARRRAFALIIVLLAVGAVFALAMRSAVVARTTMVEARALTVRAEAERDARSAVVLVLRGITAADEEALGFALDALGGEGGASGGGASAGDGAEGEGAPELPAWLVELLGLEEVQEEADEAVAARDARLARAASAEGLGGVGVSIERTIAALGLPGGAIDVELGGRTYRVVLRDGASTLDANETNERELRAYFGALGVGERGARELAEQWLDWTDEDSVSRTYGAERGVYAREGISVRNGPVRALEELRLLPAMTDGVFERVREDWSVSASGRVHAGSASEAVLASLEGSDVELARAIVSARQEAPLTAERLESLMPLVGGDALRERLTLESSGLVRARVDVLEAGALRLRLEGAAVVTGGGVEAVELRVVE
ncbi:MAG: hypothetical protein Tsb0013_04340 [Phycisphaerales bacterium]